MNISTKHYGRSRNNPSKIIELTFENKDFKFTEDVTNSNGFVDNALIDNLKQLVEELEEQNRLLTNK